MKNIFSYASDIDYRNLDCCSCEITSAEYIGRRDLFDYQPKSGTAVAYDYAVKKKKEIINVAL